MADPERTPDGRHIVVDGRRWRATDPHLPEALRVDLVGELMAARRAVRAGRGDDEAIAAARARVHDAKVALGERGHPWWEPATDDDRRDRVRATLRSLVRRRDRVELADVWVVAAPDDPGGGPEEPGDAHREVGGGGRDDRAGVEVADLVGEVAAALVDDGDLDWCGAELSCVRRPGPGADGSG